MQKDIGKIKKVDPRKLWNEEGDFTRWLEKNIEYLNDVLSFDLSIISREKKVGPFSVDLFAEDDSGYKVIIENQLEKTNHDHLGKVITYLTNLDANTAIWIAKELTEEHIKAIDWLNETTPDDISFYLIKLEVIKIGDQLPVSPLFTVIKGPSKEIKQIGAEKKEYAQRHVIRKEFWTQFINEMNQKNSLCANVNPSTDNWIPVALGMAGVSINLVVSKKYARVEISINRGEKEENKKIFDFFFKLKTTIEKDFRDKLIWERMEDNVTSRIKYQLDKVDVSNEKDWEKMNTFLIDGVVRMHNAFKDSVRRLREK